MNLIVYFIVMSNIALYILSLKSTLHKVPVYVCVCVCVSGGGGVLCLSTQVFTMGGGGSGPFSSLTYMYIKSQNMH